MIITSFNDFILCRPNFFYQMLKANGRAKKSANISMQLVDDVSDFDKIDS